ncbi:MAG: hypothetical protein C0506_08340 [Anaerolinea sp.]|nr:hypothetical protein [Anaerolinea sp.]
MGHVNVSRRCLLGLVLAAGIAVFLAGCGNHDAGNATPAQDTTSPEAVASRFFHWYASERNLGRDPITSGALDANADVTADFRQTLKSAAANSQPGVDPMLCSMPIPHAFETAKAEVSGSSASVTVGAESHAMAWRAELTRQDGVWRIHAVTCAVN